MPRSYLLACLALVTCQTLHSFLGFLPCTCIIYHIAFHYVLCSCNGKAMWYHKSYSDCTDLRILRLIRVNWKWYQVWREGIKRSFCIALWHIIQLDSSSFHMQKEFETEMPCKWKQYYCFLLRWDVNKVLNRDVGSKIKTFFVHVVGCPFTSSLLVKKVTYLFALLCGWGKGLNWIVLLHSFIYLWNDGAPPFSFSLPLQLHLHTHFSFCLLPPNNGTRS